jgi:GAF domain-containing protein
MGNWLVGRLVREMAVGLELHYSEDPCPSPRQINCSGGLCCVFHVVALTPARAAVDMMFEGKLGSPSTQSGMADLCHPFLAGVAVSGASVAVFDGAGLQSTVCSSDSVSARLDELQFELGEGPEWSVLQTGIPVLVSDVRSDPGGDWPVFAAAVQALAVRAVFTFPLFMGAVIVGVVNLYRRSPGGLTPEQIATATSLASSVAGVAARHATEDARNDARVESVLSPAMRREVHQATGMILVQLDVSATVAYSRLRAFAFSTGRSVQDVAHEVVARQLNFRYLPE